LRADSVVLDEFAPLVEVHRAVVQRNETALWEGYRRSRNQPAYVDWIAHAVGGRVIEGVAGVARIHEAIVTMPILLPAQTTWGRPGQPWMVDERQAQDRFQAWLPSGHSIILNNCLTPHSDVGRWSPFVQLDVLGSLASQSSFVGNAADAGRERLWYILANLRRSREEPELVEFANECELLLRNTVAAQLAYTLGVAVPLAAVSQPMLMTQAIQAGVSSWLDEVLENDHPASWNIVPLGEDAVRVSIFDNFDHDIASVPLRLHQLEPLGLDRVIATLCQALGDPSVNAEPHGYDWEARLSVH
jgi:hypothetical protein